MEMKDEKGPVFPEGFEQVQGNLNETVERVKQIDDQIKNIPKEQGPTLKYNPPHFVGRVMPGSRDKARLALQDRQHEIKMETLSATEAATRGTDGKSGRVVRDAVRETLFPNPYRQVSQEDRLADKSTSKDIEQSQDYMDAQLVERAAEREKDKQKKVEPSQNQDKSVLSMSARFSMSLNYTKIADRSDANRTRDREQDLDRE